MRSSFTLHPCRGAVLSLLLVLPGLASADPEPPHPIDATLARCIDADPSTLGMMACIGDADAAWDAELNAAWAELKAALEPAAFDRLLVAQRAWIAWRDAEYEALNAVYASAEGTMFRPMQAGDRMELTRARALQLRGLQQVDKVAREP